MKLGDVSAGQQWSYQEALAPPVAPNQNIAANTAANVAMATYSMPFAGKLVVEGYARCLWTGEQQWVRVGLQTSTAAPSLYSEHAVWDGVAGWSYYTEVPFIAQWNSLASGASVVLRCRVAVGNFAPTVTVVSVGWISRASQ